MGGGKITHFPFFYRGIFTNFVFLFRNSMPNCTLLLDSALRFGLRQGDLKSARTPRKERLLSVLSYC